MSFPHYPHTKDSGIEWIGQIPEHWALERLKRKCLVFPSNVDKKIRNGETKVLLCNYVNVYYNDEISLELDLMEATASADQIQKFSLHQNDVIITKDSETADDIAISTYVPVNLPDVVCGYHLTMIRPHENVCGLFIKRLFDSNYVKSIMAVLANGLTRVGLGQYSIDNVSLPFPPFPEQKQIAAFLDRETAKIDALVAEQKNLLALLKEKRQAVISHAVTKGLNPNAPLKPSGIEWLGDVPSHWGVKRIKHLVSSIEQGWSPQCENYEVENDSDWGVLKVGCVNGGIFNPSENKKLPNELIPVESLCVNNGDLLISRANTRELVGSAAVAFKDYKNLMICDKIYRLKTKNDVTFGKHLVYYLGCVPVRGQIEIQATGASSSMQNIGQSTILNMPIVTPPLHEQLEIINFLDDKTAKLDTLSAEAQRAIDLLQERRSALISTAVTGQIDVRQQIEEPVS